MWTTCSCSKVRIARGHLEAGNCTNSIPHTHLLMHKQRGGELRQNLMLLFKGRMLEKTIIVSNTTTNLVVSGEVSMNESEHPG